MAAPLGGKPTEAMTGVGTPQPAVAAQSKEQLKAKFLNDFVNQAQARREHSENWSNWTIATLVGGLVTLGATWVIGLIGQIYFFAKDWKLEQENKKAMELTEGATKVPYTGQIMREARLSQQVINAEKNLSTLFGNNPEVTSDILKATIDRHISNLTKEGPLEQETADFFLKDKANLKNLNDLVGFDPKKHDINEPGLREYLAITLASDEHYQAIKNLEDLKKELADYQKNIYGIKT